MEREIAVALDSLDERGPDFRTQVEQLRRFREQMREAGVSQETERFSIPFMERLETPHERVLTRFKMTDSA